MAFRKGVLILCAFTALGACSSAPPSKDEVSEIKEKAAEYTVFGNSYYAQGRYQEALTFFTLAWENNISVDYEIGIVRSYFSIGKVYLAMDNYAEAEEVFNLGFQVAENMGDNSVLFQYYNNMGELYLAQYNASGSSIQVNNAEKKFKEAENLITAGINEMDKAILYHNMAILYKKQNSLDKANENAGKALKINKNLKRYAEVGANYYLLSSIFSKQQKYTEAFENAEYALEYDKKAENSLGIAQDLFAMSIIKQKTNDLAQAYVYLEKSYRIYKIFSLTRDTKKVLMQLIQIAEKLGKTDESSRYRNILKEIEDTGG